MPFWKCFEVIRPERSARRHGKSVPVEACQAARAELAGRVTAAAESADIAAVRARHDCRRIAESERHCPKLKHVLVSAHGR
jgi:hypothetical protein